MFPLAVTLVAAGMAFGFIAGWTGMHIIGVLGVMFGIAGVLISVKPDDGKT